MSNEQIEKQFDDSFSEDDPQTKEQEAVTKTTAEQLDKLKAEIQPPAEEKDNNQISGQDVFQVKKSILLKNEKKEEVGQKKEEVGQKKEEVGQKKEEVGQKKEKVGQEKQVVVVDKQKMDEMNKEVPGRIEKIIKEETEKYKGNNLEQFLGDLQTRITAQFAEDCGQYNIDRTYLAKLAGIDLTQESEVDKKLSLSDWIKTKEIANRLFQNKEAFVTPTPETKFLSFYIDRIKQIERYKTFAHNEKVREEMTKALQKGENIFDGVHERTYYGQYLASCTDQAEIDRLKKEQAEIDAFRTQMTGQKVESDSPSMAMFSTVEHVMTKTSTAEQIHKVQETVSVIGIPTSKPEIESNGQVKLHLFDTRTQQNYTVYVTPDGKIMVEDIATKEKVKLQEPTPKEAVDMQDAIFHRAIIARAFEHVDAREDFTILFPMKNPKMIQSFYHSLKVNPLLEPEMAIWMICDYYQRARRNEFINEPRLQPLHLVNTNEDRIQNMTDFFLRLEIVKLETDQGPAGTSGGSSLYVFDFKNLQSLVQSLSKGAPKECFVQYLARRGIDKKEQQKKEVLPQEPKTPLPAKNNLSAQHFLDGNHAPKPDGKHSERRPS